MGKGESNDCAMIVAVLVVIIILCAMARGNKDGYIAST